MAGLAGSSKIGAGAGATLSGASLSGATLSGIGEASTRERLRELAEDAARSAAEVHAAILAGRVAVDPADRKKCDWCDYRDICRVETMATERGAGAGG